MKLPIIRILFRLFLLALLGAGIWLWFAISPVRHAPGILIQSSPVQIAVEPMPLPPQAEYELVKLARFFVDARVLSVKRYRDHRSALSPIDVTVGWGQMSDSGVLRRLSIRQVNRALIREWKGDVPPIPMQEVAHYSANLHIIPGNPEVAVRIGQLKEGALVSLRGDLVEARKGSDRWRSSLVRDDEGPQSGELFLVHEAVPFDGDQNLRAKAERAALEDARSDLHRWYQLLQKQRENLDLNNAQAVRDYNLEAQRYMKAAHPGGAQAGATPAP